MERKRQLEKTHKKQTGRVPKGTLETLNNGLLYCTGLAKAKPG